MRKVLPTCQSAPGRSSEHPATSLLTMKGPQAGTSRTPRASRKNPAVNASALHTACLGTFRTPSYVRTTLSQGLTSVLAEHHHFSFS